MPVLDAVNAETDAPVDAPAVMVTGKNRVDACVRTVVELPVYLPAPEPLIVEVQLAVAELARSHDR